MNLIDTSSQNLLYLKKCMPSKLKNESYNNISCSPDQVSASPSHSSFLCQSLNTQVSINTVILDENLPQRIKRRKNKYPIPKKVSYNNFPGSGRTNQQILADILRIVDCNILPNNSKNYVERLLQYSADLPELHCSGLPFMKKDISKHINIWRQEKSKSNSLTSDNLPLSQKSSIKSNNLTIYCNLTSMHSDLPECNIIFTIEGKIIQTTCLVDSCSSHCILPFQIVNNNDLKFINQKYKLVTAHGSDTETLLGRINTSFQLNTNNGNKTDKYLFTFIVSKSEQTILGIDFLTKFNYSLKPNVLTLNDMSHKTSCLIPLNKSVNNQVFLSSPLYLEPNSQILTSVRCNSSNIVNDTFSIHLYNFLELQIVENTFEIPINQNLINITLKNISNNIVCLESGQSIGFLISSNEFIHQMQIKPWLIHTDSACFSSLINPNLISSQILPDGTEIETQTEMSDLLDENLDISLSVVKYETDMIHHNHLPTEYWKIFKNTFENFSFQKLDKFNHVMQIDSHDIGKYNKGYLPLNFIPNKIVREKPRSYPPSLIQASQKSFDLWVRLGIFIEISHSAWNNNLLPISKTNKSKSKVEKIRNKSKQNSIPEIFTEKSFRFVLDAKRINSIMTSSPTAFTPSTEQLLSKLSNSHLSTIDVANAFSTICIHPDQYEKTAFTWNGRKYAYTRSSQGFKNISAYFHSCMNRTFSSDVFNDFKKKFPEKLHYESFDDYVLFFVDDLIVFTAITTSPDKDVIVHNNALFSVLYALSLNNFRINPKKINLYTTTCNFLGFRIDTKNNYRSIPENKIQLFKSWTLPSSKCELNSMLACLQYFHLVIPFQRLLTLDLQDMLKADLDFQWELKHQISFENVMFLAILSLKIYYPNHSYPLFSTSDASKIAWSFSVYQYIDKELRIISVVSRLFNNTDLRQSPVYKELMAFASGVRLNEHLLLFHSQSIVCMADVSCIQYLTRTKAHNIKMNNINSYLQQFQNLIFFHLPGKINIFSDICSRLFCYKIKDQIFSLSKFQSELIPPLKTNQQGFLSKSEFIDILSKEPQTEEFDSSLYQNSFFRLIPDLENFLNYLTYKKPEGILFQEILKGWNSCENSSAFRQMLQLNRDEYLKKASNYKRLNKTDKSQINANQIETGHCEQSSFLKWDSLQLENQQLDFVIVLNHILKINFLLSDFELFHPLYVLTEQYFKDPSQPLYKDIIKLINTTYPEIYDNLSFSDGETFYWDKSHIVKFPLYINQLDKTFQIDSSSPDGRLKIPLLHDTNFVPNQIIKIDFNLQVAIPRGYLLNLNATEYLASKGIVILSDSVNNEGSINALFINISGTKQLINKGSYICEIIIHKNYSFTPTKWPNNLVIRSDQNENEFGRLTTANQNLHLSFPIQSYHIKLHPIQVTNCTHTKIVPFLKHCSLKFDCAPCTQNVRSFYSTFLTEKNLNFFKDFNLLDKPQIENFCFLSSIYCYTSVFRMSEFSNSFINSNQVALEENEPNLDPIIIKKLTLIQDLLNNNGIISRTFFRKLQEADEFFKRIFDLQTNGTYQNYKIIQGLLHHKEKLKHVNDTVVFRLCLPSFLIKKIVNLIHDKYLNHPSIEKTYQIFRSLFHHPQLKRYTYSILSNCVQCVLGNKKLKEKRWGQKRSIETPLKLQSVYLDHAVNLPTSDNYTSCLIAIDRSTGFIQAYPQTNLTGKQTAQKAEKWIMNFTPPQQFITDNSTSFLNDYFSKLLLFYNVDHITTVPYQPQQNYAELGVKAFKHQLNRVINHPILNLRHKWSQFIPSIVIGINQTNLQGQFSRHQNLFGSKSYSHLSNLAYELNADQALAIDDKMSSRRSSTTEKNRRQKHNQKLHQHFYVNQLVLYYPNQQKTEGNSKALLPTNKLLHKIKHIDHNSAVLTSLNTGQTFRVPFKQIQVPKFTSLIDLPDFKIEKVMKTLFNKSNYDSIENILLPTETASTIKKELRSDILPLLDDIEQSSNRTSPYNLRSNRVFSCGVTDVHTDFIFNQSKLTKSVRFNESIDIYHFKKNKLNYVAHTQNKLKSNVRKQNIKIFQSQCCTLPALNDFCAAEILQLYHN